ncbi:MAG: nucleotidyltransferase domain-containing protein [archaeon]
MKAAQKVLKLFLSGPKKGRMHTREVARMAKISPGTASKALNSLEKEGLLESSPDGPLRKYSLATGEKGAIRLAQFQVESFLRIPIEKRDAIAEFISALPEQPVFSVLFGSTAKGGARKDSDIDILLVFNGSGIDTARAAEKAEARTGTTINLVQCSYRDFLTELKTGNDKVIASAVNTGIPLSNHLSYNLLLLSDK